MKIFRSAFSLSALGFFLVMSGTAATVLWPLRSTGTMYPGIPKMYDQTTAYFEQHPVQRDLLFGAIFDTAAHCNDDASEDCFAHNRLNVLAQLPEYDETVVHSSATYFIRLTAEGNIEKLFLSGKYAQVQPSGSQVKIVRLLKGNTRRLYNQGVKLGSGMANLTYLNDLYSEVEIIVPIIVDKKVIGAVVRLYGD